MKAKFLIFASVFLCGCSQDADQSVKQEDFQAKPPKLITMDHYSLPLDTSGNREETAGETILSDDNAEYSRPDHAASEEATGGTRMIKHTADEVTDIDDLAVKVNDIHSEITKIWNRSFVPMYNRYHRNGIGNEEVAEALETLHEDYRGLEQQVQSIKVPDSFSTQHNAEVEELKSDLSLAISNRTLALIEFKLMNGSGDAGMHSELLDIHTENSLKYMGSAEEHLETLEDMPPDDHSSVEDELVTTSK